MVVALAARFTEILYDSDAVPVPLELTDFRLEGLPSVLYLDKIESNIK